MTCATIDTPADAPAKIDAAFVIKWIASVLSILGYTLTAFDVTPWNVYVFIAGVSGWFIVGILWNDRAIMLIHIIALGAMLAGLAA